MTRLHLMVALGIAALIGTLMVRAAAPASFADPAFASRWQQDEATLPNFWGNQVTSGINETYNGTPRLVQYFDKGRMEKAVDGSVTFGLLATELVSGKVQTGDTTFTPIPAAAVPVAGDPTNKGPTYAQIGASGLTMAATAAVGQATTRALTSAGGTSSYAAGGSDAMATIAVFDDATKHNVPKGFADYRTQAGLLTIGYAIAEPFWANGVLVGGQPKDVLVQAFERRVLTYTPANAQGSQVEMGNIGAHYYQWRSTTFPSGSAASGSAPSGSVTVPTVMITPVTPPSAALTPPTGPTPTPVSQPTAPAPTPITSINGTPVQTPKPGVMHKPAAICKPGANGTAFVCTPT